MANNHNLIPIEKGRSGNPKGKPKGRRNRSTIARILLESKISLDSVDEKKRAAFEGLMASMGIDPSTNDGEMLISIAQYIKALKGDKFAYDALMDSGYGKPKEQIEMVKEAEKQYDFDLLTEEERGLYDEYQSGLIKLLAKCEVTEREAQGD